MIIVKNLTKIYKSKGNDEDVVALNKVNLVLPDKGFVAVYGASGCGKSTLLNVLGGLDQADKGEMIVNHRNTKGFSEHDWNAYRNQEVGFVFQNYYLLPHLTVFDNIAITLQMSKQTEGLKEKIYDALKQVGLEKTAKRYPRQLSGGQQQRIAIARALVANPSIILADEPTGALDLKSSETVMKSLKEVSKDHLVVMVTHNERLAKEYADRMIEISYGEISSDTAPLKEEDVEVNKTPLRKVHLPFTTTFKWSARNVIRKKGRSIPIAIASAIGLGAAGIVLSMSRGVDNFVKESQKNAVSNYPVYVTCYGKNSSVSRELELEQFPEEQAIVVDKPSTEVQDKVLSMQDDFMDYMEKMPSEYSEHHHSNMAINFNMFTKSPQGNVEQVSSSSYTMCIAPDYDNYQFIKEQYTVYGELPKDEHDLVLVIDTYNRIDLNTLKALGFDITADKIKFSDIIGKHEYRVFSNDYVYTSKVVRANDPIECEIQPNEEQYNSDAAKATKDRIYYMLEENEEGEEVFVHSDPSIPYSSSTTYYEKKQYNKFSKISDYQTLYEKPHHSMKICGIIRQKNEGADALYGTSLLYHGSFVNYVKELNTTSKIYKQQVEYGTEFDVLGSSKFNPSVDGKYSAKYYYDNRIIGIGGKERVTAVYYYTNTIEQRDHIKDYIKAYKMPKDSGITLKVKDYLEQVTSTFSSLANTFESVVLILSLVSILISVILTAILTYISVLERKSEIGLLRSLGARKRDISYMFITEAAIIGAVSGALAIGLCYIFAPVVARLVVNMIKMAGSKILTPEISTFATVPAWLIPVMFFGAIAIVFVASLVPAIIAGRKKPIDSLKD